MYLLVHLALFLSVIHAYLPSWNLKLKNNYHRITLKSSNNNLRKSKLLAVGTNGISKEPGTAPLEWASLGFEYRETNAFVSVTHTAEEGWGIIKVDTGEPYLKMHISATALHYGQACFEGLKAFHCKDGKVRLFRPDENAKRIRRSCDRVCMPSPDEDLFIEACKAAVRNNMEYVPPYGSNGALYVRPLLFGSGPKIGLQPSDEYTLIILVIPVGDYYKGGIKQVSAIVVENYDRAAPKGVGNVKVAGNYAADLLPNSEAKEKGFPICLYLDAKTNSYVEEFSTSNFIAVDQKGNYVTPSSETILASITNKSLMELAKDEGREVQQRDIKAEELHDFEEIAACGTAVVVTPLGKIYYKDEIIEVGKGGEDVGPVIKGLYNRIRAIQTGDAEDKFGWMEEV